MRMEEVLEEHKDEIADAIRVKFTERLRQIESEFSKSAKWWRYRMKIAFQIYAKIDVLYPVFWLNLN